MPDIREVSTDELAGIVSDGLEAADVTRARGLADMLDFRLARLDGLRRELDLRRTVDDADPRLTLLQERLAATELTVRTLDLEALRAVTPPATPTKDEATVAGRVVLPAGEVPEDARARLRDKGGNLVRGVVGRLDAGGAFTLRLPVATKGQDPAAEYTVVVVDSKDREIARDERAVLPAKGTVEYRELALKASRVAEVPDAAGAAAAGAAGGAAATPKPKPSTAVSRKAATSGRATPKPATGASRSTSTRRRTPPT